MEHTRRLIDGIKDISFSHIYRNQNHLADSLSKKDMFVEEAFIFYELWDDGSFISEDMLKIF